MMRQVPYCCVLLTAALLLLPALAAAEQGNGDSYLPIISGDGRFVTFESDATNLVAIDANGKKDIFVRDRQTATTTQISKSTGGDAGNDESARPSISSDGRYVTFESYAANLVPGDTNGHYDIFVRDRQTGTTTLVSKSTGGTFGNSDSYAPSVSSDGRYVTFESFADNLVAGDTNGYRDIFVRDRQTGTTTLVSKNTTGIVGEGSSSYPTISSDGRFVAFESEAANLVAGDTNGVKDIFVRDRQTATTTRVSKGTGGDAGNGISYDPSISSDGRFVAYASHATNLWVDDTNGYSDIFVRDRQTGTTTLVSKNTTGYIGNGHSTHPSISSDGRYVAFYSPADNLVTGDTSGVHDIFVRDRKTATSTLVSKNATGVFGDGPSYDPSISSAGRFVTFQSDGTNLVTGDTNGLKDIFVRDRQTGTTTLVSKS